MRENDRPGEAASRRAEAAPPAEAGRTFTIDGETWVARVAGRGAAGATGPAVGVIVVVHFCRAEEPDTPARQAYLAASRFEALYDEELRELFRAARPIPPLEARRSAAGTPPDDVIE